jgi:hypothetical protein
MTQWEWWALRVPWLRELAQEPIETIFIHARGQDQGPGV